MENNTPATNNFLNWVEIKNFKSIKDLRLDCKRVNVFIGKPNVGKSNILEGLGLLGASYNDDKYLSGAIRYNDIRDLFRDNSTDKSVAVLTNKINSFLSRIVFEENIPEDRYDLRREIGDYAYRKFTLDKKGKVTTLSAGVFNDRKERDTFETYRTSPVRKYDFVQLENFDSSFNQYLIPPHGYNLYAVIEQKADLWQEFAKLFEEQGLDFVLSDHDYNFFLQRRDKGRVKQYPFSSIADTFRRFMFYITAIESNKNSVIIFEEPEVHSFPPYTQDIAYRMIYSEENQFFVSTHSPYLLQTLVSNLGDDQLNVFVTYYEDYETKVKMLTPEEIGFVQEYSTDVFFNLDRFVPNAQSANPA